MSGRAIWKQQNLHKGPRADGPIGFSELMNQFAALLSSDGAQGQWDREHESELESAGVRPVHIRVLGVDGGFFRGKMAEKSLSLSPEAAESLGSLESIHR